MTTYSNYTGCATALLPQPVSLVMSDGRGGRDTEERMTERERERERERGR